MELRPERYLQVLKDHLTLTPQERRVVLFVLASLALGTALRWLDLLRAPGPPARQAAPLLSAPDTALQRTGILPLQPAGTPEDRDSTVPRVSLNRADFSELVTLPGIGPQRARRILEYRRHHGPFRRWEDLLAVPGIGPKTLERIRPHATLE